MRICVCVFEWQHVIRTSCALALILSQSHDLSQLPIGLCWRSVQSHQTNLNSDHLLAALSSLRLVVWVILAFQSMCWLLLLCFFCLYSLLWRHMTLIWYSLQAAVKFLLPQTSAVKVKMIIWTEVRPLFYSMIVLYLMACVLLFTFL